MRKSLMRITFRQLQIFRAVCESRSYSRAAEEMALTQPAVSLQIRQLEELIGQPLFDYVGRQLYLTEAAEALLHASADIFGRLESLDMQLSDLAGSLQGLLSLSVESSAQYWVPHLFAAFRAHYPDVSLELNIMNHQQAVRRLTQSRDDLLIMSQVPKDMNVDFFPFLDNQIIAVASPEHPLSQQSELDLQALTRYPLLVRELGSGTRQACEEYCHQKRAHFANTLQIGSLDAQREAVLAGLGVALLPAHSVHAELSRGQLKQLAVAELPIKRSWCLVKLRDKRLSPAAEAFSRFIREQRAEINQLLAQRFPQA